MTLLSVVPFLCPPPLACRLAATMAWNVPFHRRSNRTLSSTRLADDLRTFDSLPGSRRRELRIFLTLDWKTMHQQQRDWKTMEEIFFLKNATTTTDFFLEGTSRKATVVEDFVGFKMEGVRIKSLLSQLPTEKTYLYLQRRGTWTRWKTSQNRVLRSV